MHVDHIGPESSRGPPDRAATPWIRTDGRNRAVERKTDGPPDHHDVRLLRAAPARRDDERLVPAPAKVLGKLKHVSLDAARCIHRAGAGQQDPHGAAPTPIATGSSHAGWNMCQSVGASEMYRSNQAP